MGVQRSGYLRHKLFRLIRGKERNLLPKGQLPWSAQQPTNNILDYFSHFKNVRFFSSSYSLGTKHLDDYFSFPSKSEIHKPPFLIHKYYSMAPKRSKNQNNQKKIQSSTEEPSYPSPWPVLPPQIVSLIARDSSLMQNLYSKGVTKSWRTGPKNCRPNSTKVTLPWLQLSGNPCKDQPTNYLKLSFKRGEWIWCSRWATKYWDSQYHYLGCSQGVILRKLLLPGGHRNDESRVTLYDPVNEVTFYLPTWDPKVSFIGAALSSPRRAGTKHGNWNMLVWTGLAKPALLFCGSKTRNAWKELVDSSMVDPHCFDPSEPRHHMRFSNGIGFQGRFYVLSLQGTLLVVEEINSELKVTGLGKKRAVPSVSCMHYRECLVESGGEALLVFLLSRKSVNIVDYVEVYKLDIEKLEWIKKESIGDRILFLGFSCCVSVVASRVGCRRNCVYFTTNPLSDDWLVYDMEKGNISSGWSELNSSEVALLSEERVNRPPGLRRPVVKIL